MSFSPVGDDEGIERVVFERVTKTFGATAALRGVSGELRRGTLTLIEGANGSGKTTLLRVLGMSLRPTGGRVRYPPFGNDRQRIRCEIGWVSHEPMAYGDLTGRQNIELAARAHGLPVEAAWEDVRARFELGRFAERPLRTNSRGQRQRVALARALVHRPSLVLLDEPTTGLDEAGASRLLDVLAGCLEEEAAVALVTHEPDRFRSLSAHHIVLDRGRVRRHNDRP
ncbi:MAG: ABC transporter ATP-binding protein [Myxococcota bacterium]